jgi:hypothetical protein
VPEVATSPTLVATSLLGRSFSTGALTPIVTDASGRLVMEVAPPLPYDLASLPNVKVVGIPSAIGVADGAPVSTWASSVGTTTFTAAGSDRPTYDADGIGGQPSVVFGNAHKLVSTTPLGSVVSRDAAYLVFVLRIDAISSDEAANVHQNDPVFADADGAFGLFLRSTPLAVAYANDGAIRKAVRSIPVGQPTLLTLRVESGVLYVGVDGVETAGDALASSYGTDGAIQLGSTTSNKYAGHIGKFAICSAAPNAWTRSQVEASLKAEYGIA